MARTPTAPTTAQSLGALLKSARDIMRKDKGLNGDLDRLPMLTWIMFLKFLDILDRSERRKRSWRGGNSRQRWKRRIGGGDWAAKADGITGGELPNFLSCHLLSFQRNKSNPYKLCLN